MLILYSFVNCVSSIALCLPRKSHVADRTVKVNKTHHLFPSDSVKEVIKSHLLPAWLHLLQGDVLQLLHRLDVENCAETAVTTLHAIFSMATSPDELLQNGVRLNERSVT